MRFSTLWKVIIGVELAGVLLMVGGLIVGDIPGAVVVIIGALLIIIVTMRYFSEIALVGLFIGAVIGAISGYYYCSGNIYAGLEGLFIGGMAGYILIGDVMWYLNNRDRDEVLASLNGIKAATEGRAQEIGRLISESERYGLDPKSFRKDLEHQRGNINSIRYDENNIKTARRAQRGYKEVGNNLDYLFKQIIQRRNLTRGMYHKHTSQGEKKRFSPYTKGTKLSIDKLQYDTGETGKMEGGGTAEGMPTVSAQSSESGEKESSHIVKYEGKESHAIVPATTYVEYIPPIKKVPAPAYIRKALRQYNITNRTGRGLFADVYEAVDPSGRDVAVTVPQFREGVSFSQKSREQFAKRATMWKKLDHDNIVKVYKTDAKTIPHIVTERIDGSTLAGLMEKHELSVEEAVDIMDKVLNGLSYAHSLGATHRNIHPENIYITREGAPKIADWGVGRIMTSEARDSRASRIYAYSAPEQFDKKLFGRVEQRTDIFQLGVLFYEMLTGANPFRDDMAVATIGSILRKTPKAPSSINPQVPPELDELIMGALQKDQERRWDDAGSMYELMKQFLAARA